MKHRNSTLSLAAIIATAAITSRRRMRLPPWAGVFTDPTRGIAHGASLARRASTHRHATRGL